MNNKTKIIIGIAIGIVGLVLVAVFLLLSKGKTYNVSFDTGSGIYTEPQVIKKGEVVARPADPVKEGYSFVRWELNGQEYDFTTPIEGDIKLVAVWEKIEAPKYKLVFTVDGETKEIEVSDASEISLDELGFTEKDGYEIEWSVDGEKFDPTTTPITEDMNITGTYVKVNYFTVKFSSDGGSKVDNQKVKAGEKATEPTDVTKHGFILDGWYLSGKKYDFSTPVTKNITLTAKWKEDASVPRYKVTFDSDGGSKVTEQKVVENEKATAPKAPTKTGFKFIEWQLDGKKYDFKKEVTKDIKLVAKWEELQEFTVTFDTDGGSSVAEQKVYDGSKATKPTNPTKSGFEFAGWYNGEKEYNFSNAVKSNITLVASWVKVYKVTYDSNGGSSVKSETVIEGNNFKKPANPTKSGHNFKGWLLNGVEYDFSSTPTSDITLVADWEEVATYKILIEKVDEFSPARTIKVLKNNAQISVKAIKAGSDGVELCKGSNMTVDYGDIKDEKTLIVVLNDGKEVRVNVS